MDDVRLIDANAVVTIQVFDEMTEEYNMETITVAKAIDRWSDEGCPPTIDAVPVVRCRECENWNREWEPKSNEPGTHFCPVLGINSAPDFYCKNGTLAAVACVEGAVQQEVTR